MLSWLSLLRGSLTGSSRLWFSVANGFGGGFSCVLENMFSSTWSAKLVLWLHLEWHLQHTAVSRRNCQRANPPAHKSERGNFTVCHGTAVWRAHGPWSSTRASAFVVAKDCSISKFSWSHLHHTAVSRRNCQRAAPPTHNFECGNFAVGHGAAVWRAHRPWPPTSVSAFVGAKCPIALLAGRHAASPPTTRQFLDKAASEWCLETSKSPLPKETARSEL